MRQIVHNDLGDPNARQTCEARGLVVTLLYVWIRDIRGHRDSSRSQF